MKQAPHGICMMQPLGPKYLEKFEADMPAPLAFEEPKKNRPLEHAERYLLEHLGVAEEPIGKGQTVEIVAPVPPPVLWAALDFPYDGRSCIAIVNPSVFYAMTTTLRKRNVLRDMLHIYKSFGLSDEEKQTCKKYITERQTGAKPYNVNILYLRETAYAEVYDELRRRIEAKLRGAM